MFVIPPRPLETTHTTGPPLDKVVVDRGEGSPTEVAQIPSAHNVADTVLPSF